MLGLDTKESYEEWTAVFNPTSTYEGDWKKGSKMYFVGTDENGKKAGMVSENVENLPGEFVSIRHCGILDGNTKITEGADLEPWAGGLENYSFEESGGRTFLTLEMDASEAHAASLRTTWSEALHALKTPVAK